MQIFVSRNCQTLIFSFLYIIEGYIQQQYFSSGGGGGGGGGGGLKYWSLSIGHYATDK